MGDLRFICTYVDEPNGGPDMLFGSMKAMNGDHSGHVGKMFFSESNSQIALAAYIPDEMKSDINGNAWVKHVLKLIGGVEHVLRLHDEMKAEINLLA